MSAPSWTPAKAALLLASSPAQTPSPPHETELPLLGVRHTAQAGGAALHLMHEPSTRRTESILRKGSRCASCQSLLE